MLLSLIISFVFLSFSAEASCDFAENEYLYCANLSTFPNGNTSVHVLKITHSYLFTIPENVFIKKKLVSAKAVVLRYDHIKKISNGAFNGLSNLILLDLAGNNLGESKMNFENVSQLRILSLANNQFRYIHSNTFQHVDKLLVLDLFQNLIVNVDGNFLQRLRSIQYLDISCNYFNTTETLSSDKLKFLRIPSKDFMLCENVSGETLDLLSSSSKNVETNVILPLNIQVYYKKEVIINNGNRFHDMPETVALTTYNVSELSENLDVTILISFTTPFQDYLDFDIGDDRSAEAVQRGTANTVQRVMLFLLLVYLSLVYTLLFRTVFECCKRRRYFQQTVND